MSNTQKIFQESILWLRLAICANIHIKKALLRVLHNEINHHQVTGIPSDPKELYLFLQTKQNKVQNSKHLKKEQKSILLPISTQSVNSSLLDISLIRWLIQTFCNITNAKKNWNAPDATDQTICANVFRAANMRNKIFHYNDVQTLDELMFETMWKEMKDILKGLNYTEDIEPIRTETLDITKIQEEMLKEFRDHLEDYKSEISKENSPEVYIQRRFAVDKDPNNIVTKIDELINESDQLSIFANAGVGKSVTARNIKHEWGKEEILKDFYLLYFDSKKINQQIRYNSFSAPLFFSELGYHLRKKGKTEQNFKYFDCVRTTIDNLVIIVDGVDELSIKGLVNERYVSDIEDKVINNEKISAKDTIIAIYFGFLFPSSKICLLGRTGEFEQLEKLKSSHYQTRFCEKNRRKNIELLKFDDANVEEFTCLKICKQQQPNRQRTCNSACKDIYERIKDIEFCKTPTDLNSLIELHKKHPNKNIERITRTKLIIATLFNRLNEHTYLKNCFTFQTFREISRQSDFSNYLECIRTLGAISFKTFLKDNVTVQVEEEQDKNGIVYFNYENQISIKRKTLEELDLFYIRDYNYYFILEPHHTLNIEFLVACYMFSHPDKWDSILRFKNVRQLETIKFIAGLYASDHFTKDFVANVLEKSYSLDQFFNWLYNVENIRDSLPKGGLGYSCWFGLMENQKLSPSFFLLDSISQEVEIPQTFIPKTIVCFCDSDISFEWFSMEYFKHSFLTKLSNRLFIDSFLTEFPNLKLIIKGSIDINRYTDLSLLQYYRKNNFFKIDVLDIRISLITDFKSNFNLNTLHIGWCDSSTIDKILNVLSPTPRNTSSSNIPTIKCKQLSTDNIPQFNVRQTEKLFFLGLSGVVNCIALDDSTFFTDEQITILMNMERYNNKLINIELNYVKFYRLFDLPNLGNRHVFLNHVSNVTDNDVIEFRKYLSTGYSNNLSNFSNYKMISDILPFVRKGNYLRDCNQSMFLSLCEVDFKQVSPAVFANTFSLIPSLACDDDNHSIPSSHWLSLSQTEDCRINEMRIWKPQSENFEHFINTKTKTTQLIFNSKDDLKQLLGYIASNQNIHLLDKEMKVFVVKYDVNDWNYYEEILLLCGKFIEEYKKSCSTDDLLLDNISVPFHEGEHHLKWWCCEISSYQKIIERILDDGPPPPKKPKMDEVR